MFRKIKEFLFGKPSSADDEIIEKYKNLIAELKKERPQSDAVATQTTTVPHRFEEDKVKINIKDKNTSAKRPTLPSSAAPRKPSGRKSRKGS